MCFGGGSAPPAPTPPPTPPTPEPAPPPPVTVPQTLARIQPASSAGQRAARRRAAAGAAQLRIPMGGTSPNIGTSQAAPTTGGSGGVNLNIGK